MNCQSFDKLPHELLIKIFRKLKRNDILECDKVCRSWHLSVSPLLLEKVHLKNNAAVESFLLYLNNNSLFLKAIKRLTLCDLYNPSIFIDIEHLKRLFARVKTTEELVYYGSDELQNPFNSNQLLESTSRLHGLKIVTSQVDCRNLLEKLKQTLTIIVVVEGYTVEFLSQFPRLQELRMRQTAEFKNLESLLPLFEQHEHLKEISCTFEDPDEENFAETYLRLKTKESNNLIIRRLLNLQRLHLRFENGSASPNSFKFISQYLRGLKEFGFEDSFLERWSDLQKYTFCTTLLDFVSRIPKFSIDLWGSNELIVFGCIPAIFQKIFQQLPPNIQCVDKTVRLSLYEPDGDDLIDNESNGITLTSKVINNTQIQRTIELLFCLSQDRVNDLEATISKIDINTFEIFSFNNLYPTTYLKMVQQLLDKLSCVKYVSIGMPDLNLTTYTNMRKRYPQVTKLELNANSGMYDKGTIMDYISMFPSIRYFTLNYCCGIWDDDINEYFLPLHDFKLERLYLDTTPILKKISHTFASSDDYFILDILTLENRQHRMYKVSLNYLKVDRLEENDAKTVNTKIRVRIDINDLEFLNLRLFRDILKYEVDRYIQDFSKKLIESKISLNL